MSQHLSLPKDKIRFLLLEGVHQNAVDTLNAAVIPTLTIAKLLLKAKRLKKQLKMLTLLVFVRVPN